MQYIKNTKNPFKRHLLSLVTFISFGFIGSVYADNIVQDLSCDIKEFLGFNSAKELSKCINKDDLWKHMVNLENLAKANPGPDGHPSRNAGEPGYKASVDYIAKLMKEAGYNVTIQQYTIPYSAFTSIPSFSEVSPSSQSFAVGTDYSVPNYSGSSNLVSAPVQSVGGIIIPPTPAPSSTSGCSMSDFSGFTAGNVALIQRGGCNYANKVINAIAAGATGVIIFNEGNPGRTSPDGCALVDENTGNAYVSPIPVICNSTFAVGQELYTQAQSSTPKIDLNIQTIVDLNRADYNLIAESRFGDPNHIAVVEGHLDAIYGEGMLDNASGSVTILETALKMRNTPTRSKLRYIWFGGEEIGALGSTYYVSGLSASDISKIVFDLDADVTATQNYNINLADPNYSASASFFPTSPINVLTASQLGNNYFINYFSSIGKVAISAPFGNDGTDSQNFAFIDVPNSGMLTDQNCCKTQEDVNTWGGYLGNYEGNISRGIPLNVNPPNIDGGCVDTPFRWCDNLSNNDPNVLEFISKGFANVVYNIANDKTLNPSGKRMYPYGPHHMWPTRHHHHM